MPAENRPLDPHLTFLSAGGALGTMMREADWSGSPLGEPATWPQSLRTAVGLMLNSKFPMFLAWGASLAFLYNDSYAEILGSKHPLAMGRPFQSVWPEIWSSILPLITQALDGESTFQENLPLTLRRKGYDEQGWFTFSYSPLRDETGAPAGMFCAVVETTSQVLAEQSRVDEIHRLRGLFEQAPGFMAMTRGPNHVFELTNHAYMQLIGHRDVIGKPVAEALPEVLEQGFVALVDRVYSTGEPFVGTALPVKLQRQPDTQPEERFLDFIYQPIRDANGAVVGIFAQGSDVTERAEAQRELQVANQRKDEFLAMLAHELRNPLAPISTAAQVMQQPQAAPQQVKRASDIIVRQAKHMTRLLDELLDMSRVTRGLLTLRREATDVNAIVHDAVEQVRPLLDQRGHQLTVQPTASPSMVLGDRTRLVQVLVNLLNNAARYTPDGGTLLLRVEADANGIAVEVSDSGIGIAPAILPHIFDLFTQSERAPDRTQGGLGLGLSLVRNLVALHHGSVEAHSEGTDKGSRFVVRLPHAAGEAVHAVAAPDAPAVSDPACLRILVVDDNVDAADTLAMVIEAHGHQPMVEYDARSAIERVRRGGPQLMFIDIGLPDMDGYELARRLRAMPEASGLTLVALTGYGQGRDRERSKAAGFDHHLVKPADMDQVIGLIAQVQQGQPA